MEGIAANVQTALSELKTMKEEAVTKKTFKADIKEAIEAALDARLTPLEGRVQQNESNIESLTAKMEGIRQQLQAMAVASSRQASTFAPSSYPHSGAASSFAPSRSDLGERLAKSSRKAGFETHSFASDFGGGSGAQQLMGREDTLYLVGFPFAMMLTSLRTQTQKIITAFLPKNTEYDIKSQGDGDRAKIVFKEPTAAQALLTRVKTEEIQLTFHDSEDGKDHRVFLKGDKPFHIRKVDKCLGLLWKNIAHIHRVKNATDKLVLGSSWFHRHLFLEVGNKKIILFKCGTPVNGVCAIETTVKETQLPSWLTMEDINGARQAVSLVPGAPIG